jgi:hypothetical protein
LLHIYYLLRIYKELFGYFFLLHFFFWESWHLRAGFQSPLEWNSSLSLVAVVFNALYGEQSPGSSRMRVIDAPIIFFPEPTSDSLFLEVRPSGTSRHREVVQPLRWRIQNMLELPQKDSLHIRSTPSNPMRSSMVLFVCFVFMGLSPRVKPRALRSADHAVHW